MFKRTAMLMLLPLAVMLAVFNPSPVSADPGGTGHVYRCYSIDLVDSGKLIAFSKIYTCSDGPMDGPSSIAEFSTYTGKQTGWIDGECAWYGYWEKGWRDMSRVWKWCLTRPTLIY